VAILDEGKCGLEREGAVEGREEEEADKGRLDPFILIIFLFYLLLLCWLGGVKG
jgi:hypothetical protein